MMVDAMKLKPEVEEDVKDHVEYYIDKIINGYLSSSYISSNGSLSDTKKKFCGFAVCDIAINHYSKDQIPHFPDKLQDIQFSNLIDPDSFNRYKKSLPYTDHKSTNGKNTTENAYELWGVCNKYHRYYYTPLKDGGEAIELTEDYYTEQEMAEIPNFDEEFISSCASLARNHANEYLQSKEDYVGYQKIINKLKHKYFKEINKDDITPPIAENSFASKIITETQNQNKTDKTM